MNLRSARPSLAATLRLAALVAALGALVTACGESREPEPIPVEESVFGDQVEAIERTEEQVREMEGRKQDLDAQLEDAEGSQRHDPAD